MISIAVRYFYASILILFVIGSCHPKKALVTETKPPIVKPDTVQVNKQPEIKASLPDSFELKIGFLMPFHFDENLKPPLNDLEIQEISQNTIQYLMFYEGAQMAFDSLKPGNLKLSIAVFDAADSNKTENLVKGTNLYRSRLIFASVPGGNVNTMIRGAGLNNSTLVYLQQTNLKGNNLIAALPSNLTMINEMAKYISTNYHNEKLIVAYRDTKKEKELADWISARIDSLMNDSGRCIKVNYSNEKAEGLKKKLSTTKKNLIIIASSDEAFVSPLITQLVEYAQEFNIQVCGMPTWENFETTALANLEKLETIIFSSGYINYENPELKMFRKHFINKYAADPTFQAYYGFYLAKGFMNAFTNKNKSWFNVVENNKEFFNTDLFRFSGAISGGFENSHVTILKYKDYQLQPQN